MRCRFKPHNLPDTWNLDAFNSLSENRHPGLSIHVYCAQIRAVYLVKIELEANAFFLPRKKIREKKGGLEGNSRAPYLGLLIALSPLLSLIRPSLKALSMKRPRRIFP